MKAEQRLNYSRLAQTLLNGKQALLIFDEIEDVFNGSFMERSVAQKIKRGQISCWKTITCR